jgi:hypothetical protein
MSSSSQPNECGRAQFILLQVGGQPEVWKPVNGPEYDRRRETYWSHHRTAPVAETFMPGLISLMLLLKATISESSRLVNP